MPGGYNGAPKEGLAAVVERIQKIERRQNEQSSAAGTSSAVITDPDSGSRIKLAKGQIAVWDDFAANPDGFGLIYTDAVTGANLMRWFPPHSAGEGGENSVTMRGTSPTTKGAYWVYTDGTAVMDADDDMFFASKKAVRIDGGTGVDISTHGRLTITELPSVGSPDYSLGYDTNDGGTTWTMVIDSSSERYKGDIKPVEIPEAFLDIQPVTFYDLGALENDPEMATLKFGAIAERVHELGLGELLVTYRDDEPDALKYPMFAVALIPFVRQHRDEIAALKDEVAELRASNAAILARLEALENN